MCQLIPDYLSCRSRLNLVPVLSKYKHGPSLLAPLSNPLKLCAPPEGCLHILQSKYYAGYPHPAWQKIKSHVLEHLYTPISLLWNLTILSKFLLKGLSTPHIICLLLINSPYLAGNSPFSTKLLIRGFWVSAKATNQFKVFKNGNWW